MEDATPQSPSATGVRRASTTETNTEGPTERQPDYTRAKNALKALPRDNDRASKQTPEDTRLSPLQRWKLPGKNPKFRKNALQMRRKANASSDEQKLGEFTASKAALNEENTD